MRAGRLALVALVGGGLALSLLLLSFFGGGAGSAGDVASGCQVDVDTSGAVAELTDPEQQTNARTIVQTGLKLKIPSRGLTVAIATAMQESRLHNLSGGDRDSVGLFQQRAPWGSFAERTDPATAATLFFTGGRGGQRGLLDIAGWQDMPITEAAQAVQVSAYPLAYAQWSAMAIKLVSEIAVGATDQPVCGGGTTAGGSCKGLSTDFGIYQNGRIPAEALCALKFAPGQHLRADAAAAAEQMAAAYEAHFGSKLCVTDSYRDYDTQVRLEAEKGGLAATPGTSNHGWGQALDLCGGINVGPPQPAYLWMKANAPAFGWIHPAWAEPGGSGPLEFWHWQWGVNE